MNHELYELLIRVRTEGLGALENVKANTQQVGKAAGAASTEFDKFIRAFQKFRASGLSIPDALSGLSNFGSATAKEVQKAAKEFDVLSKVAEKAASDRVKSAISAAEAEERAIERTIRALERRAAIQSRLNRPDQLEKERELILGRAGNDTQRAARINQSFDTLLTANGQRTVTRQTALAEAERAREEAAAQRTAERQAALAERAAERAAARQVTLAERERVATERATARTAAREVRQTEIAAARALRQEQAGETALNRFGVIAGSRAAGVSPFLGASAFSAGLLAPAAAGLAIAGGVSLVNSQADRARETLNVSRRLDISPRDARELENEARLAGVSIAALENNVRRLEAALEDPSGAGKKSIAGLKELGISVIGVDGNARQLGPVLLETINKLGSVTDATKQAALGNQILGRSYQEILPLVEKQKELREELAKFNITSDSNLIAELDKAATKISAMGVVWDQFKAKLASAIEPIVIPVVTKATNLLGNQNAFLAIPGVAASVAGALLTSKLGYKYPDAPARIAGPDLSPLTSSTPQNLSNFNRVLGQQGSNEAVLRSEVSAAKQAYESKLSEAKLFDGSQSDYARNKTLTEVNDLRTAYEKLDGQLKAMEAAKRLPRALEALQGRIATENDRAELLGQGRTGEVELRRREAGRAITREENEDSRNGLNTRPTLEKLRTAQEQAFAAEAKAREKEEGEKADSRVREITDSTARELLNGRLGAAERLQNRGGQGTAAGIVAQMRQGLIDLQTLRTQRDSQINADPSKDANQKRVEIAQSEAEFQKDTQRVRLDAEQRVLELIQKEREESVKIADIQRNGERTQIEFRLRRAQRLGDITAGPGDPRYRIGQTFNQQLSGLSELQKFDETSINNSKTLTDDEKRLRLAQLRADVEKQSSEFQLQAEEKILEAEQKRREEARNLAGGLFDALRNRQGNQFLQQQFTNIERTVFQNLVGPVLNSGINSIAGSSPASRDANGKPTFFGRAFAGTIFENPGSAATPEVASRKDNTSAIRDLTATIRSNGTGSAGAGGAGTGAGSTTDASGTPSVPGSSTDGGGGSNSLLKSLFSFLPFAGLAAAGINQIVNPPGFPGKAVIATGGGITAGPQVAPNPNVRQPSNLNNDLTGALTTGLAAFGAFQKFAKQAGSASAGGSGFLGSLGQDFAGFSSGLGSVLSPKGGGIPALLKSLSNSDSTASNKIGAVAGTAGTLLAGGLSAINDFSNGGGRGIVGGVSDIALTAGQLSGGFSNPVGAVLETVGIVGQFVKQLFGDPKQNRAQQIAGIVTENQYLAPPTINSSQSVNGFNTNFNKYGRVQSTSPFAGFNVAQPYLVKDPYSGNYVQVPGSATEIQAPTPTAKAAGSTPIQVTMNIHALDTQSILNRSRDIGNALIKEINGSSPVGPRIQQLVLGT